jgi:hypothetical protein
MAAIVAPEDGRRDRREASRAETTGARLIRSVYAMTTRTHPTVTERVPGRARGRVGYACERARVPCATGAASEISNLIYNSGASLTGNLRSEVSIFYQ